MMYSKLLPVLHCSRLRSENRHAVWLSDDANEMCEMPTLSLPALGFSLDLELG